MEPIDGGVARINGVETTEKKAVKKASEWAKKIWG